MFHHELTYNYLTMFINNLLTLHCKEVTNNLLTLLQVATAQSTRISYSYFTAMNALLHNIELIKQIFSDVVNKLEEKEITKDQFDQATWKFSEVCLFQLLVIIVLFSLFFKTLF